MIVLRWIRKIEEEAKASKQTASSDSDLPPPRKRASTKSSPQQDVPKDIITSPQANQRITSYYGLAAGQFTADQKAMLTLLIQEYTHNFAHPKAHQLFDKITKSGIDKVYFAWVGSLENNKPHYYIINGPDFLIEYDNVGFQNDGNHIHAILREKDQDFGDDILKQHYPRATNSVAGQSLKTLNINTVCSNR